MKAITTFTALTSLIIGINVHAQGNQTGGGGDRITCLEDGRLKYYLLDVYEANRGRTMDLSKLGPSMENRIEVMKQRLAKVDPARAEKYAVEVLKMLADIRELSSGRAAPNHLVKFERPLKDIDDADERFDFLAADQAPTAQKCSKAQLVRQEKPKFDFDETYFLDDVLWRDLDSDNQVATLYHEVIYKEMRQNGAQVSKSARRLNGLILSDAISTLPTGSYYEFVRAENLRSFRLGGLFELAGQDVQLDAGKNIRQVNGEFEYRFGSLLFRIASPRFERTDFIGADNLTHFHFRDGRILPSTSTGLENIRGGQLEPVGFDRLALRGMSKDYDGGRLALIVDGEGRVSSREENGYFNQPLLESQKESLQSLIGCVKSRLSPKSLKRAPFPFPEAFLEEARRLIGTGEDAALQALADRCRAGETLAAPAEVSAQSRQILDSIRSPKLESCQGFQAKVRVGLSFFGANAGWVTLQCLFTDGTRRTYAGPLAGINCLTLGANVQAGRFEANLRGDGSVTAGKRGAVITEEAMEYLEAGVWIPKKIKQRIQARKDAKGKLKQHQQAPVYNTPVFDGTGTWGTGFFAAGMTLDAAPMLPLWKKKDLYTSLVSTLSREILIRK